MYSSFSNHKQLYIQGTVKQLNKSLALSNSSLHELIPTICKDKCKKKDKAHKALSIDNFHHKNRNSCRLDVDTFVTTYIAFKLTNDYELLDEVYKEHRK